VLPTKRPALHPQTYELVMAALLVDPAHHGALLGLVQAWPNSLYQPAALIDAIAQRMRRAGGETRELWQVGSTYLVARVCVWVACVCGWLACVFVGGCMFFV
jgi:hypothetical protein